MQTTATYVPIQFSEALRDARPDLVELETFNAGHTLCWNTDPERWQEAVTTWLQARVTRCPAERSDRPRRPSRSATPGETQLKPYLAGMIVSVGLPGP